MTELNAFGKKKKGIIFPNFEIHFNNNQNFKVHANVRPDLEMLKVVPSCVSQA